MVSSIYTGYAIPLSWGVVKCLSLFTLHILAGSILFDLVHWLAHHSARSSNPVLRGLARSHTVHHQYFDRQLNFNPSFSTRNLLYHLQLELLCQVVGAGASWQLTSILGLRTHVQANHDIIVALTCLVLRSGCVAWREGRDSNHIPYHRLPKDPHSVTVGPQYHALHHVDPQAYFGSTVRLLDWLLGTAATLRGRRIAITGARGAFGQALLKELGQEKGAVIQRLQFGRDWDYDDYRRLEATLRNTDILILAHGSKNPDDAFKANCESPMAIIDAFLRARDPPKCLLLPEIWYVGSEAELHGAWTEDMRAYTDSKRAFVPFARACYEDQRFIYRHIVPAAFSSSMGRALVSASWAAKVTLWWVRRGARYVPVTYTGFAFLNYLRFQYWVEPDNSSMEGRGPGQKLAD